MSLEGTRNEANWWDEKIQKNLGDLRIAVIGEDLLSEYVLTTLAAIGATCGSKGKLFVCTENGYEEKFLRKIDEDIPSALKKINPDIKVAERKMIGRTRFPQVLSEEPDVVMLINQKKELTDSILECELIQNTNVYSTASDYSKSITCNSKEIEIEYSLIESSNQCPSVCGVTAAIIVENMFKEVLLNQKGKELIVYDKNSLCLNGIDNNHINLPDINYNKFTPIVIGAGSIGNFVLLNLTLMGFKKIVVVDYDNIENRNLNRLILHNENSTGKKIDAAEKILHYISPELKLIKKDLKLTLDNRNELVRLIKKNRNPFLIGCVDNYYTRSLLNYIASKKKIPYLDGGSGLEINDESPYPISRGNVHIYVPKKSKCLECEAKISYKLKKNEKKHQDEEGCSCTQIKEDSVIFPNMASASLITGELNLVLSGSNFIRTDIEYNSNGEEWISGFRNDETCKCDGDKKIHDLLKESSL